MTPRPTRATVAGRAFLDLRKLALAQGRPTAELIQLYALEGFLARLQVSMHSEHLVLKGGTLLAAFDARRTTRDIDLAASGIANSLEAIERTVLQVLAAPSDDGLSFEPQKVRSEIIREGAPYPGVRVIVPCGLASARSRCQVDVNVGDPILPAPELVNVPRLLGGPPIRIVGYPLTMVLAEKIVTAVERGNSNTRWRDFADILVLSRHHPFEGTALRASIDTVASHRGIQVEPLTPLVDTLGDLGQSAWDAWRKKLPTDEPLPKEAAALLDLVCSFADPVLTPQATTRKWNPKRERWV